MPRFEDLPYRPCAGLTVINRRGLVFIGRRISGPEHIDATHVWQMPQGGIDEGEEPLPAALRELYEETGMRSVSLIAEAPGWIKYDLPPDRVGIVWKGRYRGQTQKWFAFRFEGEDSEIEIRQILEAEDFGAEFTPELKEREERQRAEMAAKSRQNK